MDDLLCYEVMPMEEDLDELARQKMKQNQVFVGNSFDCYSLTSFDLTYQEKTIEEDPLHASCLNSQNVPTELAQAQPRRKKRRIAKCATVPPKIMGEPSLEVPRKPSKSTRMIFIEKQSRKSTDQSANNVTLAPTSVDERMANSNARRRLNFGDSPMNFEGKEVNMNPRTGNAQVNLLVRSTPKSLEKGVAPACRRKLQLTFDSPPVTESKDKCNVTDLLDTSFFDSDTMFYETPKLFGDTLVDINQYNDQA